MNYKAVSFATGFATVCLWIGFAFAQQTAQALPSSSGAAKAWTPNASLVASLGDPTPVASYTIRVPKGYEPVQIPASIKAQEPPGFQDYFFALPYRPDNTTAGLTVQLATLPSRMPDMLTIDQALRGTIQSRSSKWENLQQSPVERGKIAGLNFERAYFKGTSVNQHSVTYSVHAFAYVAIDGRTIINIVGEDSEPYNTSTLPVIEAAALTFQKG